MAKILKISVIFLAQFLAMLGLISCGGGSKGVTRINVPIDQLKISQTQIENKIPLKAALYLDQNYKDYQIGMYHCGNVLSSGAEKILKNLFQEAIKIDVIDQPSNIIDYDIIVMPHIEKFEYRIVQPLFNASVITQVAIKWRIATSKGIDLYENIIQSDEKRRTVTFIDGLKTHRDDYGDTVPAIMIIEVLNDQFQKTQDDIYSNGWWKKQWWKDASQ
jgi:hypothetical protein